MAKAGAVSESHERPALS